MKFEKYPLICEKCGKLFLGDKPIRKYCSTICAGNFPNKITKVCLYCGSEFKVQKHREKTAGWCCRFCYDAYRQTIREAQPSFQTPKEKLPKLNKPKPKIIISKRQKHTKIGTLIPCTRCDNMMPFSPRRKYCNECKQIVSREQSEIRRRKRGIKPKPIKQGFNAIDNHQPCAICGWNEATCDRHHIIPIKDGGTNKKSNIIVLCPNHHRLADFGIISINDLLHYNLFKKH